MTNDAAVVQTTEGRLQGAVEDGVVVFRGVPYAAPPVGELRWRATQPHPGWEGTRDATQHGPVCPQPANVPWNWVMGSAGRSTASMGEDCLTLTISTPRADAGKRPVVVYIHGGGNIIGAGSWDAFSVESFARNGDVVAVGVNYRFSSFGYLLTDEDGQERGNWWLDDQLAALRWVQDNIAAFGGDPEQVTVMGQSGGAASIATIMGLPVAKELFKRAVLMGLPFGHAPYTAERARELAQRFFELLGVTSLEEARALPWEALVAAEPQLTAEASGWHEWHPGFSNVIDGVTLHEGPREALARNDAASSFELLIGWTREEYALVAVPDVSIAEVERERVLERLRVSFGEHAEEAYAFYETARPGALPANVLIDALSDERYRMSCIDVIDIWVDAGRPPFVYQLDWQTRILGGLLGAPHCMDIAFGLNAIDAWGDGVMWDGTEPRTRQALAETMHAAWTAFVRGGDPNHGQMATWPCYDAEAHTIMSFDLVSRPVDRLVDAQRELWKRLGGRQS
ncbi:MAG TPA: carboxylesterase family protein [Conexibacter sp.]|nr:carboxylesterase family protein [Conexibacter sp.]